MNGNGAIVLNRVFFLPPSPCAVVLLLIIMGLEGFVKFALGGVE